MEPSKIPHTYFKDYTTPNTTNYVCDTHPIAHFAVWSSEVKIYYSQIITRSASKVAKATYRHKGLHTAKPEGVFFTAKKSDHYQKISPFSRDNYTVLVPDTYSLLVYRFLFPSPGTQDPAPPAGRPVSPCLRFNNEFRNKARDARSTWQEMWYRNQLRSDSLRTGAISISYYRSWSASAQSTDDS